MNNYREQPDRRPYIKHGLVALRQIGLHRLPGYEELVRRMELAAGGEPVTTRPVIFASIPKHMLSHPKMHVLSRVLHGHIAGGLVDDFLKGDLGRAPQAERIDMTEHKAGATKDRRLLLERRSSSAV